jgi:hypothetical protein
MKINLILIIRQASLRISLLSNKKKTINFGKIPRDCPKRG